MVLRIHGMDEVGVRFPAGPLYDTSSRKIADLARRLLTISRFQNLYFSCMEFRREGFFIFHFHIYSHFLVIFGYNPI